MVDVATVGNETRCVLCDVSDLNFRHYNCSPRHSICSICFSALKSLPNSENDVITSDCIVCKSSTMFPDEIVKYKEDTGSTDNNTLQQAEFSGVYSEEYQESCSEEFDNKFETILNSIKQKKEYFRTKFRIFDLVKKAKLNMLNKSINGFEQIRRDCPPTADIAFKSLKKLKKKHKLLSRASLNLQLVGLDSLQMKIHYSMLEKPYYTYSHEFSNAVTLVGCYNCFYLLTNDTLYEIGKGEATPYSYTNFVDLEVYKKQLFLLRKAEDEEMNMLPPAIFKWDNNSNRKFLIQCPFERSNEDLDYKNTICFQYQNDLLFYETNTGKVAKFCDIFFYGKWFHREIKGQYLYLLGDQLNLQKFNLNSIINETNYQGENLHINLIEENISIRNDIISKIQQNFLLFTNDFYIFIIDPTNDEVKAYPQRVLFEKNRLYTYFRNENEVHFCLVEKRYSTINFTFEAFKLFR
ncbi:unnamed protein product [Dimorphilus gyrociliatus]|uniref:Uncharacterized protein n=1 Tax=Dimorphilus gyrociliatus TaxID=2664684 RepID=A0A7I8VEK6_9ANNE|nr:unnamed protein product [Dimorphilus gyrociliatus]